jgi:DNA-directed RNA polymerase specialized sigma subunit
MAKQIEPHLADKRKELMYSLKKQGYNDAQIGRVFGLSRVRAHAILKTMPANYVSPWIKRPGA